MTNKTKLFAALAVAFASQAAVAGVDFNGYLRSGSGSSSKGGNVSCFRVNGASALQVNGYQGGVEGAGRLGNECDTYGEIALGTTMGEAEGTKFGVHTLVALGTQENTDYEQTIPAFREAYGTAQGFGKGAFAKSTVWAGKRYYDRKDVHIVDYFWLEVAGPGAGIQNIDLGFGKFSYAMMRTGNSGYTQLLTSSELKFDPTKKVGEQYFLVTKDENQQLGRVVTIGNPGSQKINHDFRLEGINLGKAGSLGMGLNLIRGNSTPVAEAANKGSSNGWSAWISHSNVFGTVQNGLTFQIARDAGTLNGAGLWWAEPSFMTEHKGWRLIDAANFEIGDNWNGQAFLAYGKEKYWYMAATHTDKSIVVRPVYHFNDVYSIAFEGGKTWTDDGAGTSNSLTKFTIAPQLSMGSGFYARPVLRAYYTHASWNKGGATVCTGRDCLVKLSDPGGAFANATSGNSVGVQMEAWW
jgi:maltoporin